MRVPVAAPITKNPAMGIAALVALNASRSVRGIGAPPSRPRVIARRRSTSRGASVRSAEATIARASITDQTGVGIEVTNGTLDLEDLIVERVGPSEQLGARGLATFRGTVTLRRTSFRDVAGWAIDAYEESVIDAVDLHAEQLTPDYFGYGALRRGGRRSEPPDSHVRPPSRRSRCRHRRAKTRR
jgi:hypothetical protein